MYRNITITHVLAAILDQIKHSRIVHESYRFFYGRGRQFPEVLNANTLQGGRRTQQR